MRNLIAIFILAITASPLKAQGLNADVTMNGQAINRSGYMGLVQEYDGKKPANFKGGSADFSAVTNNAKTYLEVSAEGLGTGEGKSYLNLTMGGLDIKASENTLVHRQPYLRTGMLTANSTWFRNTNEVPTDELWNIDPYTSTWYLDNMVTPPAGPWITEPKAGGVDVYSQSFKRTESDLKASFTDTRTGDYTVRAGRWEEREQGTVASKSSGKVMQTYVDRSLKLFNIGGDAGIGNGAVAYDYVQGSFSDDAALVVISTISSFFYQDAPAPNHKMSMRSLAFRFQPVTGYNVTGSLNNRTRESSTNGYKAGAYTASLAASHAFGKKLNVTVKGYGHMRQIEENEYFVFISTRANRRAGGVKLGSDSEIDRANFTGEMLANYDLSDKIAFNLGYKVDNNYRRHAEAEVFTASQTYQDGGFVDKNTQWNAPAKQNTQNTYTAGVNLTLPLQIELALATKMVRSNVAVFESLMSKSDEYTAELYAPVVKSLSFIATGFTMKGKNEKSHHTNSRDTQDSYMAGLEWDNEGRFTAGANYAFDSLSNRSDAYYAGYTGWYQMYDVPCTPGVVCSRPQRTLNALYRYTNDTQSVHGSAKLSKEYTLSADSSYTRSRSKAPVNILTTDGTIIDTEPADIRIVNAGFSVKYSPVNNKSLSASIGVRRQMWTDKLFSENSGRVDTGTLSVSAKF